MNDPKKQLLDPFGTMITLIELAFRPLGTKFGINNHCVEIHLPTITNNNNSLLSNILDINNNQSYQRFWNADSRENISKIGYTIIRIIEWYVMPTYQIINNKDGKETNKELSKKEINELWFCIKNLVNYLCIGLNKLIETYNEGNVIWTIQNYCNLLKDSIEGNYTREKIPAIIIVNLDGFIDYGKIKSLWTLQSIKEIHDLYYKCFQIYNEEINEETKNIDTDNIIVPKNDILSASEKNKKIENYISAIKILLELKVNNFRILLNKSTSL